MPRMVKKDGFSFSFDSTACDDCAGECCIGESGYIWVSKKEIVALRKRVNLSQEEFITRYLTKIGYRYTLKELKFENGHRCLFFDIDKRECIVYEDRPLQCRTFPFWDYFKKNTKEVEKECPGIYKL